VISVPAEGRVAVPARGENRAPPSGSASETNNVCQIKSKLLHTQPILKASFVQLLPYGIGAAIAAVRLPTCSRRQATGGRYLD